MGTKIELYAEVDHAYIILYHFVMASITMHIVQSVEHLVAHGGVLVVFFNAKILLQDLRLKEQSRSMRAASAHLLRNCLQLGL